MNYYEGQIKNGERLIIRIPKEADAADMIDYLNTVGGESDNLLFGSNDFHLTVDQEKEMIRSLNNDPNRLMLVGEVNNKIVSIAQISAATRTRIAHNSEIAISVKKDYWRMGIAGLMIEELLRFASQHATIRNVSLGVRADNYGAIKLYEKLGFEPIVRHKDYFNIDGAYYDLILMDRSIEIV